jgi:hypothetical protein
MLCLSYYAYVFSSTKLEIRAEQVLPGSEEGEGCSLETQHPKFLLSWLHRHPLPVPYADSRLAERKWEFSVNRVVGTV